MRGYTIWAAVLVPLWLLCVLCTYWEPVVRDSWGHVWWHHVGNVSVTDFARDSYLHNNPRLGQVITYLLLAQGPWHVIVTPLVEVAMFYLLATLVLGRWPSLRRPDDALVVLTLVAMVLMTCPLVGPMLFYRPYTGNYLYGFVLDLALLVPYRLALKGTWLSPVMFVVGLCAGLSNEHTDPALAALCTVAVVVAWRRGELQLWMLAGLAGLLAGSAALYFAPGQNARYEGLATKQSVVERIANRGAGNLDVFTALFHYARLLAIWLGVAAVTGWVARQRVPRIAWLLAATSLAITLTLLASPKLGPRLYLASVAFACAAVASVMLAQLQAVWSRALAWTVAGVLALVTGIKLLTVYAHVGPVGRARLASILSAPKGSSLQLAPLPEPRSRWFIGDDLIYEKWNRFVSFSFSVTLEMTQRRASVPPDDDP